MKILDTHTHFHDPAWDGGLVWPNPGEHHFRRCMPEDYQKEVGAGPVVALETSPRTIDDERLAKVANSSSMISCFVSNLQPLDDGFEDRLNRASQNTKWRGLRLRPIDTFELDSTELVGALEFINGRGHVELGIRTPERLFQFRNLCLALPSLNFVLTHCGHPSLTEATPTYDYNLLYGLENVFIKLSPPQLADFSRTAVRHNLDLHIGKLIDLLPKRRLMFGSNWPVSQNPKQFTLWIHEVVVRHGVSSDNFFWDTANQFYRLNNV